MKISILATTLLIGLGNLGTDQSVQAAPIKLSTLSFASQTTAPAEKTPSDLLVPVFDRRGGDIHLFALDGFRSFRNPGPRARKELQKRRRVNSRPANAQPQQNGQSESFQSKQSFSFFGLFNL